MAKKTLSDKFYTDSSKLTVLDKDMWGAAAGSKLYISSAVEIANFIKQLPAGQPPIGLPELRTRLAAQHQADLTCPLTSSIFTRVAIDYWLEDTDRLNGELPFERLIGPKEPIFKKLDPQAQIVIENYEFHG